MGDRRDRVERRSVESSLDKLTTASIDKPSIALPYRSSVTSNYISTGDGQLPAPQHIDVATSHRPRQSP